VLVLEDVLLTVGPADLLDGTACLRVEPGETVGIVGNNGCGKSTLLKCIAGLREVDAGRCVISPEASVGYLEQVGTAGSTRSVYEEARSRMASTAATLAVAAAEAAVASASEAEASAAAAALQNARDAYDAAGGPGAEKRIAAVLDGLGFQRERWAVSCAVLSGGWQMRVALARLLLSPAGESANSKGLLLLDEPTNHLDAAACAWLARWLRECSAAVLLVSHDDALLQSACSRLAEVRGRTLHTYVGGYASFLAERSARAAAQLQRAERLDREAEKLSGFITRFGAKATKASAAKSKEKALAKLDALRDDDDDLAAASAAADSAGPGDASSVRLRLPPPPPCAEDALVLTRASFCWLGGDAGLADVSLTLRRGMRVLVLGANGSESSPAPLAWHDGH
jgi:ATPase subunit of ABC transporter with duplicated ATPase domains